MHKSKILLVEDDKITAKLIKKYLEMKGYQVTSCVNGNAGFEAFSAESFDLCILDIMIPYKDGFTLAQEIRKIDEFVPILFVSAKSMSEDRIKAFKIGADDYITKPFDPEELLLRVEAILKRHKQLPKSSTNEEALPTNIQIGKYTLDYTYQKLILGDESRELTSREAELLRYLYLHKNQALKRELILVEIWGDHDYYKGRSLDVFMSRLRKYLKDDESLQIVNIHGVGFKFVYPEN